MGTADIGSASGNLHASIESEKKGPKIKNNHSTDEHITEERNVSIQRDGLTPPQLQSYAKLGINLNDSTPNLDYNAEGPGD